MNILFFTHEKEMGGASKALITLIDNIKNDNDNIYVVVPFKHAKIVEELKNKNVNIINCLYGWWEIPTTLNFAQKILYKILYKINTISIYILKKKIKKLNIDIVHSNTSVIDIGAKLAKSLRIKHIWHFREFTGTHLKFIKGYKKSYEFINKNTDKIIYVSEAIEKYYSKYISEELGTIIYDGVQEKYCQMKTSTNSNDIVNFLLVGTLEKNKGQMIAIKAANYLIKNDIKNFKIFFAGGDPTGYKKELDNFITKNDIKSNIKYLGFVNNIMEERKKMDVELMCAPNEAFGLVTIEAMMSSNPVIGSNSGATPELVKDHKNGLLYKKEDYIDLANKMKYFIENRNEIKRMGQYAYEYSRNNYSSLKNSEKIKKLYFELLNEKGD